MFRTGPAGSFSRAGVFRFIDHFVDPGLLHGYLLKAVLCLWVGAYRPWSANYATQVNAEKCLRVPRALHFARAPGSGAMEGLGEPHCGSPVVVVRCFRCPGWLYKRAGGSCSITMGSSALAKCASYSLFFRWAQGWVPPG